MGISTLQYMEMQARLSKGQKQPEIQSVSTSDAKESELHNKIKDFCRSKGWVCLHGSTAHKSRRTLGEPDFVILAENGIVWLVECKTSKGKLSPEQEGLRRWAFKLGHVVHIVRSIQDFNDIVSGNIPIEKH